MYPILNNALQRPFEVDDSPSVRALTIDLDVHHDLLAVLIGAVDRLPGGPQALAGAIADLNERSAFAAALAGEPDQSTALTRHFIAAHAAGRTDRATHAAQDRPTEITSREEDAHVE